MLCDGGVDRSAECTVRFRRLLTQHRLSLAEEVAQLGGKRHAFNIRYVTFASPMFAPRS